ncbi:MAG TPA: polynucleotide adenylyltransferase PcnB [Gammaproteobacteria bacterium]|nr:polynucleotide adenylyltransferase PcnB [Gammaproteobacteria bacterium]
MSSEQKTPESAAEPVIIPRPEHTISRAGISPNAVKVLYRLHNAGYQAYLVGGGVRDLLLGREPKDFDVGTDAHPEQVQQLFRNCRLIGRRFRLAHVVFGREVIEVATFRALYEHDEDDAEDDDEGQARRVENGRILRDNVYGTLEEDAWRRDFTVNALYYNIADFSVVDYVGGMADLKEGVLRVIGDAERRYREDPVRMLRAVRFAAKLGFRIHADSERSLWDLGHLLREMPPARLYEEILKLFMSGAALPSYELLRHYDLFDHLFPFTEEALAQEPQGFPQTLLTKALANTDARVNADKPVTPAFLFAALLWAPMSRWLTRFREQGMTEAQAIQSAGRQIVSDQCRHVSLPKRFSLPMREIWALQPRFEQRTGKRPQRLLANPRFRAAYDFLLLRGESGEVPEELCQWWTEFQTLEPEERDRRTEGGRPPRKRRRRRSPRRTSGEATG